jgi:hypothetical protein
LQQVISHHFAGGLNYLHATPIINTTARTKIRIKNGGEDLKKKIYPLFFLLLQAQRGLKDTERKPLGHLYLGVTYNDFRIRISDPHISESNDRYYGNHCVQLLLELPFHQPARAEYQMYVHLSSLTMFLL